MDTNDYYIKYTVIKKYLKASEKFARNYLCLFTDGGRDSMAYIYTYRLGGVYRKVYGELANDQDFAFILHRKQCF